jgi:hypothetical protein
VTSATLCDTAFCISVSASRDLQLYAIEIVPAFITMLRIFFLTLLSVLVVPSLQFPELEQADIELPAAQSTFGNVSDNAIFGQENSLNLLYGRQTCAEGYGQCGVF